MTGYEDTVLKLHSNEDINVSLCNNVIYNCFKSFNYLKTNLMKDVEYTENNKCYWKKENKEIVDRQCSATRKFTIIKMLVLLTINLLDQ